MNKLRLCNSFALCLLSGIVVSYSVAWWFEYERTSRVLFADVPRGQSVLQSGPSAWPVSPSLWPQSMTPPSSPDRVDAAIESAGTEFRTFYAGSREYWRWEVNEIASGWPLRCAARLSFLQEHISVYPGSPTPDTRVWYGGWPAIDVRLPTPLAKIGPIPVHFPLRPIWAGLAVNSAFYGCFVAAGAWAVGLAVRANRRRRGLCEVCKYPRGVSAVCTECGRACGAAAQ